MKSLLFFSAAAASGCSHAPIVARESLQKQENILMYQSRQKDRTPQQVLEWLAEGNERFLQGRAERGGFEQDSRQRIQVSSVSQRPLAAVLSCIDSRTTPELIFDTNVGDLFTARVGANVVNEDILGSLEISAESGVKVIIILGHSDCGGVKAACNHVEFGHMTQLFRRIQPSIDETNKYLDRDPRLSSTIGPRVTSNRRYVTEVSRANARHSRKLILEQSPILREKIKNHELVLVSALYDVETGAVKFDMHDEGDFAL